MIKVPLSNIIEKIKKETNISEQEIEHRIDAKMDALSGLISREGAAHIIANDLGIKIYEDYRGKLQIKNILSGMRDVETTGKVQSMSELTEFQRKDGNPGKVRSFLMADETGSIRVVCWNSKADELNSMKLNDIVKIKSGYVRENLGRKEVHMNDKSNILLNPEGESIGDVKPYASVRKKISELTENDGNAEILGTVVQVFDIRFFEVCRDCNKRLRQREDQFACDVHGIMKPMYSYVLNLILDDGSETIRSVFFKNQAERLLGKGHEEILRCKENMADFEKIKHDLLGNQIKVVGKANKNQMFQRMEFIAQLVFPNVNPEDEIKKMEAAPSV